MRKEEMEQRKELHLEETRKQVSATENMAKMLENFQTQQVNMQQQYQMMMQQQSHLFLSVVEKLSKN